jgi:hypothetical protein
MVYRHHQSSAVPVSMDADHTCEQEPIRLDEALRYAVARIESDPRNVDAIVRHFGWDGHTANAEPRPGQPIDLARERAKQAASGTIERLREYGFVPDVVERSISAIKQALPLLDAEVCETLMNARLCFTKLSCEALSAATHCFGAEPAFEIVRLGSCSGLVKPGTAAGLASLTARAQEFVQSWGCANALELTHDAQDIFGPRASPRFTEVALRLGGRFEWLDQETKWFWYIPDRGHGSNRLVQQIQRVLAATPRIQVAKLRSAIRRDNGFGCFTPPSKVIESICRRLLFLQCEEGNVIRVPGMAPWNVILTAHERLLVEVLHSHGPVLEREQFLEHCRRRGMDEPTFNQLTSCSLILQANDAGLYATSEASPPPAKIRETGTTLDTSASATQGFLSEGRVFLAWKLHSSQLQVGALRVPEPINTFVQGDYNLKTFSHRELGLLHVRQRACWSIQRLALALAAEADDTLVIVFNLRDHTAIGIVGNDDVVAQVKSGLADKPLPHPDWSARKKNERGSA